MVRNSFTFYGSFFDTIKNLEPELRLELYDAIIMFALTGRKAKQLSSVASIIFKTIQPQLANDIARYENGKKGGAPRGNNNAKKTTEKQPKRDLVVLKTTKNQPNGILVDLKTTEKQPKNNRKTTKNNQKNDELHPIYSNINITNKENTTISDEIVVKESDDDDLDKLFSCDKIESVETKKTLADRQKDFHDSLIPFVGEYDNDMLRAFYDYWSELENGGEQMRFEKQTFFSVGRRLATWAKNEKQFEERDKKLNNNSNGNSRRGTYQTATERLRNDYDKTFSRILAKYDSDQSVSDTLLPSN